MTRTHYLALRSESDFNSHAHVERDSYTVTECPEFEISTHTLTWSVTFRIVVFFGIVKNFNSHAHVERDVGYLISKCCLKDFNSHAHVERDKVLQ